MFLFPEPLLPGLPPLGLLFLGAEFPGAEPDPTGGAMGAGGAWNSVLVVPPIPDSCGVSSR
ncbi:hypothetical protein [Saccharomonospora viridis]|uniref:hypothetical protein n=1 Tax=Saccharomonospora viridis TaxID=1852 RepID=UPI0001A37EED|nr:hypothetical protein [Saccharomonospora viridis]